MHLRMLEYVPSNARNESSILQVTQQTRLLMCICVTSTTVHRYRAAVDRRVSHQRSPGWERRPARQICVCSRVSEKEYFLCMFVCFYNINVVIKLFERVLFIRKSVFVCLWSDSFVASSKWFANIEANTPSIHTFYLRTSQFQALERLPLGGTSDHHHLSSIKPNNLWTFEQLFNWTTPVKNNKWGRVHVMSALNWFDPELLKADMPEGLRILDHTQHVRHPVNNWQYN